MESNRVLLTPEGWDANDDKMNPDVSDFDDTDSECNSSSQSIPLARYPSLAELSSIATNCEANKMVSDESLVQEEKNLPVAGIEDCKHQITSQLLNSVWNQGLPATPPKLADTSKNCTNQSGDDPLTPTANLKMLVSAASPAIRDREIKKRELFPGQNSNTFEALHMAASSLISNSKQSEALVDEKFIKEESSQLDCGGNKITVSRKDKSLGLLCQKFLSKYPEYPKRNEFIEISLDDVAKDLSVERRRIYDIVNVLESVEVITRYAKNRYVWHGKSRLPTTLVKLKNYAVSQGFQLKPSPSRKENPKPKKEKAKKAPIIPLPSKLPLLLPKDTNVMNLVHSLTPTVGMDQSLMPPPPMQDTAADESTNKKPKYKENISEYCRKDKSLGVLSQKFLMMFLVSENRYVTLEDAANVLIGDEEEGQTKYKTKVRRLYDIANILSSLQLIEKVHIHSIQTGRKPGFRWIGIDPDKLELVAYTQDEIQKPPSVKRICAEKSRGLDEGESAVGRLIRRRPSQQQLRSEDPDASKCKLPRSQSERILGTKKHCGGEEDGFSVQELTASYGADLSAASPTEAKFRAELKKLHQQYPDRMSQLLSACRHSDDFDARKSRRSLFISGTAEPEDAPEPKRRRSADDFSTIQQKTDNGFSHSSTSPFKSIDDGKRDLTPYSPKQSTPKASLDHSSPEQKILLERQKQQKLLEEQRGFDSQDERWKRMERELEKAFPSPGPSRPMMVHQSSSPLPYDELVEQSSVAIQASLIDDVSPLKPLSYYRKLKSPWKDPGSLQSSRQASSTPSPIQFQNNCALNSMSNPHALTPTPILPATERPIQVNNACPSNTIFLQIPAQPGNGGPVLWATATPPSGNSTPSPDQLIKVMGQTVNTPLLYSPRSLTPTPEPGNVELSQVSSVVEFTTPCVTMGDVQQPLAGNQPVNSGNAIPSNQALTIQLPTMHHLSSAEMFSSSPVSGSLAHLQFNTPVMKLTDINKVVPIETPTTTVQLLADVSKRLSLPLNSHQPS